MSRLDSSFHPALTQEVIDKLFQRTIYTALSFVETDPELIVKICGIHYSKVQQIRNAILVKFSSSLVTGAKYYDEVLDQCAIVRSGIGNLDELLDGGFMTGNIYELCGGIGSGKTQMCMTIAVNVCHLLPKQQVLYVDTKNDVSGTRVLEIAESRCGGFENAGSLMSRIKMVRILCASHLTAFLNGLGKELRESSGTRLGFRVLIIDSLSALFFRYLGDDRNEGLAMLNGLANVLHYIAVEHHVVVLLTNLVTNWSVSTGELDGEEEEEDDDDQGQGEGPTRSVETPVLGRYWVHVPDTRINLKRLEDSDKWLLVVMKSTNEPIGKTAQVTITKDGVT